MVVCVKVCFGAANEKRDVSKGGVAILGVDFYEQSKPSST
jgi:hypothetical protein